MKRRMSGSQDLTDYATAGLDDSREGKPRYLICAKDSRNITIEGLGVIDVSGTPEAFPKWREDCNGDEVTHRHLSHRISLHAGRDFSL